MQATRSRLMVNWPTRIKVIGTAASGVEGPGAGRLGRRVAAVGRGDRVAEFTAEDQAPLGIPRGGIEPTPTERRQAAEAAAAQVRADDGVLGDRREPVELLERGVG